MSNIIDQYVLHLESLDLTPAKRSSATEVNFKAYEKVEISATYALDSWILFAGCERLGRVLQCFSWPSITLFN